jgi:hypothetical protein
MRHVYIVTRIVSPSVEGVVEVPNLGVFSNLEGACAHFFEVVKDRARHAVDIQSVQCATDNYNARTCVLVHQTYVKYQNDQREEVRLERWTLK